MPVIIGDDLLLKLFPDDQETGHHQCYPQIDDEKGAERVQHGSTGIEVRGEHCRGTLHPQSYEVEHGHHHREGQHRARHHPGLPVEMQEAEGKAAEGHHHYPEQCRVREKRIGHRRLPDHLQHRDSGNGNGRAACRAYGIEGVLVSNAESRIDTVHRPPVHGIPDFEASDDTASPAVVNSLGKIPLRTHIDI